VTKSFRLAQFNVQRRNMSMFIVNLTKTTLVFTAIVALASGAYASTISSFSVSTSAIDGTPCSASGSGPGSESCRSTSPGGGAFFGDAEASVTLTDNSIQLNVDAFQASGAQAFASITHDDLYAVPVNGPISALLSLTCIDYLSPLPSIGHFSLGSTTVSPPVESIFTGASQGSGPCGTNQIAPIPPFFVVSLVAANNIVQLQTHIDARGSEGDNFSGMFIQLTVNGFLDANGNPITATLLPEPGTLGTFGLALLAGVVGMRAKRKRSGSRANHGRLTCD
jgi:hypothetical protein